MTVLTHVGPEPDWDADDIQSIVDGQFRAEAYAEAMGCQWDHATSRRRAFVSQGR